MRPGLKSLGAIIFVLGVTACAPKPAPLPPPPPPPPVIILPPPPPPPPVMPLAPYGAATTTLIPPLGSDNVRVTPNRGISREEHIWNFRIAMNVAALNCRETAWDQMIPLYSTFLNVHKARLSQANNAMDAEYRKANPGRNGLRVRDTKTAAVYNYFSFPPLRIDYCNMALGKLAEVNAVPATAFPEYSIGALSDIDGLFIRFYDAYVQYERDLADWHLRFGPNAIQPTTAPAIAGPVVTGPPITIQPAPAPPITVPPQPGTKP